MTRDVCVGYRPVGGGVLSFLEFSKFSMVFSHVVNGSTKCDGFIFILFFVVTRKIDQTTNTVMFPKSKQIHAHSSSTSQTAVTSTTATGAAAGTTAAVSTPVCQYMCAVHSAQRQLLPAAVTLCICRNCREQGQRPESPYTWLVAVT